MVPSNSIKIGKLFGIEVGVNITWFLIFFVLVFSMAGSIEELSGLSTVMSTAWAVVATLLLFASVIAHEYGHALTARTFGIGTHKIILHVFGGIAFLESEPRKPLHEFFIALAGPAVSIALALVFGLMWWALDFQFYSNVAGMVIGNLAILNLFLGVFNCVPGFPLDGGRVVRAIVWGATGQYLFATRVAAWGGVIVGGLISFSGLLSLVGVFGPAYAGGILRFFLGLFVIHLALLSMRQAVVVAAFQGRTVRDLMQPVRIVVPARMALSDVNERFFAQLNVDHLPVVDGDRLLGYISREDIQAAEPRQLPWIRAHEAVHPYQPSELLAPGAAAITALERLSRTRRLSLPVFQGRRLLGHVTHHDIARHLHEHKVPMKG